MADKSNGITEQTEKFSHLMDLYGILFEKFNQEGDGIWERFNIMVGINIALFGGFVYIFFAEPRPTLWCVISLLLALVGVLLTSWSIFVLDQLWLWHEYWRDVLIQIEESFPRNEGWVRPLSELPCKLKNTAGRVRLPLRGYTQPFLLIFAAIWMVAIVLVLLQGVT